MSYALTECPVCGVRDQVEIHMAKDRHYGIPGLFRLVRCIGCSLVFLNPMCSDTELSALYPNDYYAYQDHFRNSNWTRLLKKALGVEVRTRDPHFRTPGRMLDLGCGSGWFLAGMQDLGWETYGVEISSSAAEVGQKAGLNIYCGTLEAAKFPADCFDYIRSNHSFEHMSDPGRTLDEAYRVLRCGGKLLIGVPNIEGVNAKIFGEYWWYLGAPVHPFNYSPETLRRLLLAHGFVVESITYNSDWSGILGSLQIWLNRENGRKSSEGRLINSHLLRILCHWLAKATDFMRLGDAIEVVAMKENKFS